MSVLLFASCGFLGIGMSSLVFESVVVKIGVKAIKTRVEVDRESLIQLIPTIEPSLTWIFHNMLYLALCVNNFDRWLTLVQDDHSVVTNFSYDPLLILWAIFFYDLYMENHIVKELMNLEKLAIYSLFQPVDSVIEREVGIAVT